MSTRAQFVGVPYDWTPIYVSLHTGPLPTREVTEVSGTGYTRSGDDITWTSSTITVTHAFLYDPRTLEWDEDDWDEDDPYELDMTDATTTGIGDPLADVLRNIDDLLEGQ